MNPRPHILIRSARESDIDTIAAIMADTFLADQTRYIPEPVDPDFVRAFSQDLVSRRWQHMLLAELDGNPVGMAYVEGAKIEAVNVLPAFQRRGIGTALMDHIEATLAEATLDTQEANTPARTFYASRGYTVIRHWLQTEFTKTPVRMVTMHKKI